MTDIYVLQPLEIQPYEHLALPDYIHYFTQNDDLPTRIRVGASFNGDPAALVLAEIRKIGDLGILHSFGITPQYQNEAWEQELLRFTEMQLIDQGVSSLQITLQQGHSPSLADSLTACNWKKSLDSVTHYQFDCLLINSHSIWSREIPLPKSYSVHDWQDITDSQWDELKQADWYPYALSPFESYSFGDIDQQASLWLRQGDDIVGWIVAKRSNEQFLYWSSMFIREDAYRKHVGIPFIQRMIRRQVALGIPYGCFDVNAYHQQFQRFVNKRFLPYIFHRQEVQIFSKIL
ncbi:hypothetical protein OB236_03320 [Paenibacillus sp. WQ 127069]|uniref:N-acetyltransferase domain-containing protein n=1 Tax=Paenibacillus baimaensis TaxID=2982185 RepID=A0ABT2UBT6_9BACL|nr:hypothetical protein [Paenibacillus sp. WQ 127069]MCU6791154.1 hypothetical protein [Paenibacillus sp. WQ 127069]